MDGGFAQVATMVAGLAETPREVMSPDGGVVQIDMAPIAERLTAVQDYIAEVVEYLSARDQTLVEWIQGIAQHTDGVIAAEGARVEEALTGRLDLSVFEADGRIREAVTQQLEDIHDRLQEHAETLGQAISVVEVKTLALLRDQDVMLAGQTQQLETMVIRLEAVRQAAIDAAERVSVGLHERMADLTDQMHAESEDMRRRLIEREERPGRRPPAASTSASAGSRSWCRPHSAGRSTRSTAGSTPRSCARCRWAWPTSSRPWTGGSSTSGSSWTNA